MSISHSVPNMAQVNKHHLLPSLGRNIYLYHFSNYTKYIPLHLYLFYNQICKNKPNTVAEKTYSTGVHTPPTN